MRIFVSRGAPSSRTSSGPRRSSMAWIAAGIGVAILVGIDAVSGALNGLFAGELK